MYSTAIQSAIAVDFTLYKIKLLLLLLLSTIGPCRPHIMMFQRRANMNEYVGEYPASIIDMLIEHDYDWLPYTCVVC